MLIIGSQNVHLHSSVRNIRSQNSNNIDDRSLTVTLITPSFRVLVVTNHAMTPAAKPMTAPPIQPHLFAFFQVIQSAIGTTPEPKITPINVWQRIKL